MIFLQLNIGIFSFIVLTPCVAVAILGVKLINQLGYYPTKSARISKVICLQLLGIEFISFLMLAGFFHVFSD